MFNVHGLVDSLPDPGDWVLPILEELEVQGTGGQVTQVHSTRRGQRCGLSCEDAAAVIAMSQLH